MTVGKGKTETIDPWALGHYIGITGGNNMENKEKVMNAYASGNEINCAKEVGEYGMEFINTKKILDNYISKNCIWPEKYWKQAVAEYIQK